jgi:crotonobetainyl-CoA:carnitine CoA-transferase CaiB-like acyl-CoA transferase
VEALKRWLAVEDERYARGISTPAAANGEHTEEVLNELGYRDDEI